MILKPRYTIRHVTTANGTFTDLFDRKRQSTSRMPGIWLRDTLVAIVENLRKGKRGPA